jgi:hypothetical protein
VRCRRRGPCIQCLGQLPEHSERLLEERDRLAVGRAGRRPLARLAQVLDRFIAKIAASRVMGQLFEVFVQAIGVEPLDRADQGGVQRAPPIFQEASVCHVVCQRVLEGVLELRNDAGFVDELGALQALEATPEGVLRKVGERFEECEGDVLADHRSDLHQVSVFGRESVDAGGEHGVDRRRHLDRLDWLRQPILPALTDEHVRLDEHPDGFFQEERVTASDEQLLERRESDVRAEELVEELTRALRRKRIEAHLAVAGLAAPGVLILGTIVHDEQDARRRDAVDQIVENLLRLGVDPVKVLDDQT